MTRQDAARIAARRALGLDVLHLPIWANVGRRHPDYGLTGAEHQARKAERRDHAGAPPVMRAR